MMGARATDAEPSDPYDIPRHDARPIPLAHPARLATAALMKGRDCVRPSACRFLELGCADATHLLPIALAYPDSRFVGVEPSRAQIAAARADVEALGLQNVELIHADFVDLDQGLGAFDYIVAHGVFSWVSDAARARILAVFAHGLTRRGVGYLSYNTRPGWGVRGHLRDLLLAHTRQVPDPRARVARAREYLATLRALSPETGSDPYRAFFAEIVGSLASRSDRDLLHEYLTEHNRAFAYAEIASSLDGYGLCIVDDLVRSTTSPAHHAALYESLARAGLGASEVEGAIDLLTDRQMRASLIARGDGTRASGPVSVLQVISRCELALAGRAKDLERPRSADAPISTRLVEEAISVLASHWPGSVGFHELILRAGSNVGGSSAGLASKDHDVFLASLMQLIGRGHLELRAHPPGLVSRPSERPRVSPLTRLDAARGRPVTSQLHASVRLDPEVARVAVLLDGTRGMDAICEALRPDDPAGLETLRADVEARLRALAHHGLLLG